MGIRATQPQNITYCVLGPSIDFISGAGGEGQPCTQWCSLDLSLKPSWGKKERKRHQLAAIVNKRSALPCFLLLRRPLSPSSALCSFTDICSKLGHASQSSEPSGLGSLPSPKDQHMASGHYPVRLIAPSCRGRSIMSPDFSMLTPDPAMPAQSNFPSSLPRGRNPHWAAVCQRHLVRCLARTRHLRCCRPVGLRSSLGSSQERSSFQRWVVAPVPSPSAAMRCLAGGLLLKCWHVTRNH